MACAECPTCLIDRLPKGGPEVGHEIHITIGEHQPSLFPTFRSICEDLGMRAYAMEILVDAETSHFEMMSASSVLGSDADAVRQLIKAADALVAADLEPIRVKIESVPWHPTAPQNYGAAMPAGAYWESHFGLWIREDEIASVLQAVTAAGGYLSINRGKPPRTAGGQPQFRASATARSLDLHRPAHVFEAQSLRAEVRRLVRDVDTEIRTEFTWLDMAEQVGLPGGPPGH